jgi:hypothetical protein
VSKRGQVTVFIVIGIIILVAVMLLFFFRSSIFGAQLDLALEQDAAQGDALVLQEYVSSCLQDVSIEGLQLLGQHGGYIDLSRDDVHDKVFEVLADPTESDAVQFNTLEIPYWWYEDSEHGCVQCSITTKNMPTLALMEKQVAIFVQEQLGSCLADFTSLEAQGFDISEDGSPRVVVTAVEEMVYVQLTYPLSIENEGVTSSLTSWYVEIPIPLAEIYDAAAEVMYMEIADQYLEQMTLNIISAYSGLDEERLPPFAAFTEGYGTVFWVHQLVKEQLHTYLNSYIPLIQIEGTSVAVEIEPSSKYGTGFFDMLWRESVYPFGDIAVNFIFDDFAYYLDVTPRSGELLRPQSFTQEFPLNILSSIQTNHYNFYYDVSYPVVVSLRSENALYGEGYTFFYGMEANIRDNRNVIQWAQGKGSTGPWDGSLIDVGLKEGVPTTIPVGIDFETNKTIYEEVEESVQTLICDEGQRLSGEVHVGSYNGLTGDPISSASVSFVCGTYRTCAVGTTDVSGSYDGPFPICVGGVVRVEAEGYFTEYVDLDTFPEQENKIIALLEPIVTVPVSARFIPTSRLGDTSAISLQSLAYDMVAEDSVLITIDKIHDHVYDKGFSQVVSLGFEADTIDLVTGVYEVTGLYLNQEGIVIPARVDEINGEKIEYPEIDMTPAMLGAVYLDGASGYWNVTKDVHDASSLTFYVFRMNDPYYFEDLAELSNFTNYSKDYRDVVEPTWG